METVQKNDAPKPSKKELRIAKAKQRIADWRDEEKPEDIVSGLAYRAHLCGVLRDLGFEVMESANDTISLLLSVPA